MRIIVWLHSHFPTIGGIQTAARHLLPALAARGHEVAVVASHLSVTLPDRTEMDGVPIYRFDFYEALQTHNLPMIVREGQRVARLMQEFAPDIVHVKGLGPNLFFFFKARQQYAVPFLFTSHAEDSRYLRGTQPHNMLRHLLHDAAWVTTVSQLEARRLSELLPTLAGKISCVYQGLAMPQAPRLPPPTAFGHAPRLLCIGRVEQEKNFGLALRAFARVAPAFPQARLIFAGDGTQLSMLQALCQTLGIAAQVDFLGWVQPERVYHVINQASALVLSSSTEGLPLVGVEGAQMARPLLATDVNGTRELVVDGETGLLVPPDDEAAMAAAMHTLLADPARTARMGEAALTRVQEKFSLTGMVDGFSAIYARIAAPAPLANRIA